MISKYLRLLKLAILTVIITVSVMPISAQVDSPSQEDRLKAAFIYQFTNYIVWPEKKESTSATQSPFVITVVGKSNLVDELTVLAQTKTVKGRPIKIILVEDPSKIVPSPIIFVNSSDPSVLLKCVAILKNTPSLIVSHGTDFAKKGAMINFFIDKERLRFEISRTSLSQANFQVGSQLLYLAKLVD